MAAAGVSSAAMRPGPVDLQSDNVDAEWTRFKQKFTIYLIATQQAAAPPSVKWALLMGEAGDGALEVYNSFKESLVTTARNEAGEEVVTDHRQDYEAVLQKFDRFAAEKKSLTALRDAFSKRNQRPGESIPHWETDLRNMARVCEFGNMSDEFIKDRIILGNRDQALKKVLLRKPELNLDQVLAACRSAAQVSKTDDEDTVTVDAIRENRPPDRRGFETRNKDQHHGDGRRPEDNRQASDTRGRRSPKKGRYDSNERSYNSRRDRSRSPLKRARNGSNPRANNSRRDRSQSPPRGRYDSNGQSNHKFKCMKCGRWHYPRSCPAFGKKCSNCQKMNHWTHMCRSNRDGKPEDRHLKNNNDKREVHTMEVVNPKPSDGSIILDTWALLLDQGTPQLLEEDIHMVDTAEDDEQIPKRPRKEYTENLRLAGKLNILFKLDPGSEANVLPKSIYDALNQSGEHTIQPRKAWLKGYGKNLIPVEGIVPILVEAKHGVSIICEFYVINLAERPIIGIETCEKLNLIQRVHHPCVGIHKIAILETMPETKVEFIARNNELFTGRGRFKQTVKIQIDPNINPGISPARRYSYSITEKLKGQLETLVNDKIIAKVTGEFPKFTSNLVIREKPNGDLRLCLDPELLNKAIIRQRYPIPSIDELANKVRDATVFTVLDLKDGFWHAELDAESSLLCAFSTPHGTYKFLKLPFGVSSAPEIFQFLNDQAFEGTGAIIYFDDCLVVGKTLEEHDRILQLVLERARAENIRFNPDKVQYRKHEVKFLGHLWSKGTIKIDPDRMRAIQALEEPQSRKHLQRALGVFNHLRNFIPHMATIAAPLYELLSNTVHYEWQPAHSQAFLQLKQSVCQAPSLTPFDPTKGMIVQADASQTGLGACLLQGGRLVSSASRKLTDAEVNYAQVEKEMLALSFAAEKFDKFIYAMPHVKFQSDHKPLVSIFQKPLHKITNNRLKKFRLKMLKYHPLVEYLPGKEMYLTDLLSRQYITDEVQDDPEMVEVVHEVTKHLPISPAIKLDLIKYTACDQGLQAVEYYYQHGWPKDKHKARPEVLPYWPLKNELFVEDGLVIIDEKVVVPVALRKNVLATLHKAHLGIDKTKARARQVVYWPGITKDIHDEIKTCRICERHSDANKHEPLHPHAIPQHRFEKISCDILDFEGKPYLVVVDNLSKWLEIKTLPSKQSQAVINALREIFSTHGIPCIIFGDNNPLSSMACKEYASEIGAVIETSSPRYPQSNGLAEKGVGIARKILTKTKESKTHYLDALREYNNTPITGTPYSPSQILMSRMCRTLVPARVANLDPKIVDIRPILKQQLDKKKERYDARAGRRPVEFHEGDAIVYYRNKTWQKGTVVRRDTAPRSYIIRQTNNGRYLRRTTYHLKQSKTSLDYIDKRLTQNDIEMIIEPLQEPRVMRRTVIPVVRDQLHPREAEDPRNEEHLNQLNPPEDNPAEDVVEREQRRDRLQEKRTRSGREVRQPKRYRDL